MGELTDLEPIRRAVMAAEACSADLLACLHAVFPDFNARSADAVASATIEPTPGSSSVFSIASRNSAVVWHDRVLFAIRSGTPATIAIGGADPVAMTRVPDSDAWIHVASLAPGTTFNYTFFADGRNVGANSVAVFNPLSYRLAETPRGRLLGSDTIASTLYAGAVSKLWVYVTAATRTDEPLPLMLWLDGEGLIGASDALNLRAQVVIDNLAWMGRLPPMAHVFLGSPQGGDPSLLFAGQPASAAQRSLQYDTVSDMFVEHLEREVLPVIERIVPLRTDGTSRAIAGASSGAVAAFTAAWFRPQQWSRVMSSIGSYVGLRWGDGSPGGQSLPAMVRRSPRKNLRIWLSDGAEDLEADENARPDLHFAGSWPLGNIAMANALKSRFYDFHFRFGTAMHSHAQAGLDLPEALAWLWRGYDQTADMLFEQEVTERAQPFFRVAIANRASW